MNIGVTEILFMIVAAVATYFGFTTGRKVERPKAMKEGHDKALESFKTQSTEQVLERVTVAVEARTAIERMPDDELREQAHKDPNNRLRGM